MRYCFKSTKELEGCYLASGWNGMRDIYKVTKSTPKSIELTEVSICGDANSCRPDPTYRPCRIEFKNGKPIFFKFWKDGEYKPHVLRKIVKFDKDGYIKMLRIGWNEQGFSEVIAKNDEEAENYKFEQYWG